MKKLFLCVGAAKAGTTWLYKQLEQNPQIFFSPRKEINYFFSKYSTFNRLTYQSKYKNYVNFVKTSSNTKFSKFRAENDWYLRYLSDPVDDTWYRQLFEGCRGNQYASDFSPSTSKISQEGWESISRSAEEVKIVYMMRSPLDRLWSHIKFQMARTNSFTELESFSTNDYANIVTKYGLLVDGKYGTHLNNIYKAIEKNNVKVCFFEDINARPTELLHDIESFLDTAHINYNVALTQKQINKSQTLRMPDCIADLYTKHLTEEVNKLRALGFQIPDSWRF